MQIDTLKKITLLGLIFGIIASFLFHFLYEWTGDNVAVGLFAPINESVWEHGKLLTFPFLFYAVIEYFLSKPKDKVNYLATKFFIITIITILLPVLFYSYSEIIGQSFLFVDILIAIILIVISYILSYLFINNNYNFKHKYTIIAIGLILVLAYFVFTYSPPNIDLFIPSF